MLAKQRHGEDARGNRSRRERDQHAGDPLARHDKEERGHEQIEMLLDGKRPGRCQPMRAGAVGSGHEEVLYENEIAPDREGGVGVDPLSGENRKQYGVDDEAYEIDRQRTEDAAGVKDCEEVVVVLLVEDQPADEEPAEHEEHVDGEPAEHQRGDAVRDLGEIMRDHDQDGHQSAQAVEGDEALLVMRDLRQRDTIGLHLQHYSGRGLPRRQAARYNFSELSLQAVGHSRQPVKSCRAGKESATMTQACRTRGAAASRRRRRTARILAAPDGEDFRQDRDSDLVRPDGAEIEAGRRLEFRKPLGRDAARQ